jgi:hypothetical protein
MHEKPMVEISIAELCELAKGKAIADALTALIHNKKKHYDGFTREEVELLDMLYFVGEEA